MSDQRLRMLTSRSGLASAEVEGTAYHSRYDPVREAENFVTTFPIQKADVVFAVWPGADEQFQDAVVYRAANLLTHFNNGTKYFENAPANFENRSPMRLAFRALPARILTPVGAV